MPITLNNLLHMLAKEYVHVGFWICGCHTPKFALPSHSICMAYGFFIIIHLSI